MRTSYDLAIIGGGPAGLAVACLAAEAGFTAAVIEKERAEILAAPPRDGREIALTHRSRQILERLGVWDTFPAAEIAPIRRACVRSGSPSDLLSLDADGAGADALGFLVSNNVIRAGLYATAQKLPGITLLPGTSARDFTLGDARATVTLADGTAIAAPLLVAADSRMSDARRKAGIGAEMRDFGRICIVCRLSHEKAHEATAYEWFADDRTLAILPLNDNLSSVVLTIASDAAAALLAMPPDEFAADVERRFESQWGRMRLVGNRHAYPLVGVFAHRFHARRFVLAGDAAVGMHPVTAHGFNFGLRGADRLVSELQAARRVGRDLGEEGVLAAYDAAHRKATYPLYLATNAMVGLYTDPSRPAQFAREALLRIGNVLPPVRWFMTSKLTELDAG